MRKTVEIKEIQPVLVSSTRLVKSEDLNHHGTLFAGRASEWFVEAGFFSVAAIINPREVVCHTIHGMTFRQPVVVGQILKFESKVIYSGSTSLVSYIEVITDEKVIYVSGFITFIHVNEESKPSAHNLKILPHTNTDISLNETVKTMLKHK